jgi:uncharacterized membrane protein YphA (DoxX/SURF4 family)
MRLPMRGRHVPGRLATGGYILHSGLDKWNGGPEQAAGIHRIASGAFPFLKSIPAPRFLRLVSAAEITIGTLLLSPFVPAGLAGAALTGFSSSLLTMYLRTPALHKPKSVWPTQAGMAVSKDVWMLGIGLGLMVDTLAERRHR